MSWTPTLMSARIDWALTLAGSAMQGLLNEPWMSAIWGLMVPYVAWLP